MGRVWVGLDMGQMGRLFGYLPIFRAKIHFIILQKQNTMWTGLDMHQDQPIMALQTEKPNRKTASTQF